MDIKELQPCFWSWWWREQSKVAPVSNTNWNVSRFNRRGHPRARSAWSLLCEVYFDDYQIWRDNKQPRQHLSHRHDHKTVMKILMLSVDVKDKRPEKKAKVAKIYCKVESFSASVFCGTERGGRALCHKRKNPAWWMWDRLHLKWICCFPSKRFVVFCQYDLFGLCTTSISPLFVGQDKDIRQVNS